MNLTVCVDNEYNFDRVASYDYIEQTRSSTITISTNMQLLKRC